MKHSSRENLIIAGDTTLSAVTISVYAKVTSIRKNLIHSHPRSMPKKNMFALIFFYIDTFNNYYFVLFFISTYCIYYVNVCNSCRLLFIIFFLIPLVRHDTNLKFLKLLFEMIVNN